MKRLIAIAGLTLLVGLPATADIDWVGNRTESNIFRKRMEHSQEMTRPKRQKRTRAKKTTPATKRVTERYPQVQVNGK